MAEHYQERSTSRRARAFVRWLRRAGASVLGVAVVLAGCESAEPLSPTFDEAADRYVVQQEVSDGLVQTLRLSHLRPEPGDTLWLESVVTNQGSVPVQVSRRICGLDLRTDLELEAPWARCAGYSARGELAPGDSLWTGDGGVIAGGPGRYVVRVRHLLDPVAWLELEVEVGR